MLTRKSTRGTEFIQMLRLVLATPKTRPVSKQVFSLIKFKRITQTCQVLGRDLILKKVLTGTICEGPLFEAGLRADESLTWSVLAIPPFLVKSRANRQKVLF